MAIKNKGVATSVLVVKDSHGVRVEKNFPLHSPNFDFKLIRRGRVTKAKIYYNRDRKGKAARIREDVRAKIKNLSKEAPSDLKD